MAFQLEPGFKGRGLLHLSLRVQKGRPPATPSHQAEEGGPLSLDTSLGLSLWASLCSFTLEHLAPPTGPCRGCHSNHTSCLSLAHVAASSKARDIPVIPGFYFFSFFGNYFLGSPSPHLITLWRRGWAGERVDWWLLSQGWQGWGGGSCSKSFCSHRSDPWEFSAAENDLV